MSNAPAKKGIKDVVQSPWIRVLGLCVTSFGLGFGAYGVILQTAELKSVPSSKVEQLEAEIKTLKEEKTALATRIASANSANTLSPPPDPNERVLYYKNEVLILRGNIEGWHNTQIANKKRLEMGTALRDPVLRDSVLREVLQDNVLRERAKQLAELIGEIAEDKLRPAVKVIKHEYGGWAYLMAGSSYGEQPSEYLSAEARIDPATKALEEFDLALALMDDITRAHEAGNADATPIYKWINGSSADLNRTHYLKAIALAVIARAKGSSPQAALVELEKIDPPAYLDKFPAKANPDLAWALNSTPSVNDPSRSSADEGTGARSPKGVPLTE